MNEIEYMPNERVLKINLPSDWMDNIDKIIITVDYKEELVIVRSEEDGE